MEHVGLGIFSSLLSPDQMTSDPITPAVDPLDVLELTQAFVAVLLSGQAGPLTAMQIDLLETIQVRATQALAARESELTILSIAS